MKPSYFWLLTAATLATSPLLAQTSITARAHAGAVAVATNGTVKTITITSDPALVTAPDGPQTVTSTITVGGDPVVVTMDGSEADADRIMEQVEAAMRQAMDRAGQPGAREAVERVRKQLHETLANAQKNTGRSLGHATGGGFALNRSLGGLPGSEPSLVATTPMNAATREEWLEDLKVMDKLLRDEIQQVDGNGPRHAMGIRLFLTDRDTPPLYLEGYGGLFRYRVEMPLAASGKPAAKRADNQQSSAWEKARQEVKSSTYTDNNLHVTVHTIQGGTPAVKAQEAFEGARLEELVDAIIRNLGEARNIRHLAKGDAITVVVSGTDDAGAPRQLTLKAKKEDLEEYGSGKLKLEELKKKVLRSVD